MWLGNSRVWGAQFFACFCSFSLCFAVFAVFAVVLFGACHSARTIKRPPVFADYSRSCDALFHFVRSEKLQNESFPNSSTFGPEFCPEFSPNFSRTFRASFRGRRRPEKIHQKSPPFFNAKFPGKHEKIIHKILLESRQSNTLSLHLSPFFWKETQARSHEITISANLGQAQTGSWRNGSCLWFQFRSGPFLLPIPLNQTDCFCILTMSCSVSLAWQCLCGCTPCEDSSPARVSAKKQLKAEVTSSFQQKFLYGNSLPLSLYKANLKGLSSAEPKIPNPARSGPYDTEFHGESLEAVSLFLPLMSARRKRGFPPRGFGNKVT